MQAYAQQLRTDLEQSSKLTAEELESSHSLPFTATLAYDPMTAKGLDAVQASPLQLKAAELDVLAKRGFVISGGQQFPSYAYGYASIYAQDLPVYISADSILDAVHRSYDEVLKTFERVTLTSELTALLENLRTKLASQPASQNHTDLDVYLSVAQGLLLGATPVDKAADSSKLIALAQAASGPGEVSLFGVKRNEDFSQYKPRGHYSGEPALENYFRAMMWLGRVDFRLVETDDAGTQVLRRPQVEAMLLLSSLFDDADRQRFEHIDATLRMFVGESDNMTLSQVPALLVALGVSDLTKLSTVSDDTLKNAILADGFGKQQIMSALMQGGVDAAVPLNASFLLFGQRYIVDSHVLANVVWDRTRVQRMMPSPLDVGFAALGNDQALALLHDELAHYSYSGNLASMRTLVDQHDETFWRANLYNDWLSALRTLSPTAAGVASPAAQGMPSVTATEAWGRRMLGAQLGSWAQLRHDTILYAKQSYTSGAACEFPDAAVDPYPAFYAAIVRFAEHGLGLATLIGNTGGGDVAAVSGQLLDYFTRLRDVGERLHGIAETQAAHGTLSAEQLAFINDAVVIKKVPQGCTSIDDAEGWYAKLFYQSMSAVKFDPTIADVHTQPTDESGNDVGKVLHVGTGRPRLMVVTQDGCGEPRAYVGLAGSYYERVTEKWLRLTDQDWAKEVMSATTPPEPLWMQDLVAQ